MPFKFNVFTGTFDLVNSETGGSGSTEDGSAARPYSSLNIKKCNNLTYYLIKENLENVVTRSQIIDGVLIVDGVNTVL